MSNPYGPDWFVGLGSRCTACGKPITDPADVGAASCPDYVYCEACEADYQRTLAEELARNPPPCPCGCWWHGGDCLYLPPDERWGGEPPAGPDDDVPF